MGDIIPQVPLSDWIESILSVLTTLLSTATRAVSTVFRNGIRGITGFLDTLPPIVLILVLVGIAWAIAGRRIAIGSFLGFLFIWNIGLWGAMVSTLVLVFFATILAVAMGLPLGIVAGLSDRFFLIVKPILDFMQTMPAFVYLIPAIPFFGLGATSAIMSTVIFSIPPTIRLTALGIRQIDKELVEAADSFGSTTYQKLVKLQLPLSLPTVMAGINQTIMLALSMVVIASMIGAGGLGGEVWRAIQRLRPGDGFAAGLAVVILAMILDRVTQKIAAQDRKAS
ncbi:MAG: ABC transporter permease subunit [Spirochaetaceae bacterium]|nr:MAG: ABC transporter permease subunit [Spirochaetaceae bacterium]